MRTSLLVAALAICTLFPLSASAERGGNSNHGGAGNSPVITDNDEVVIDDEMTIEEEVDNDLEISDDTTTVVEDDDKVFEIEAGSVVVIDGLEVATMDDGKDLLLEQCEGLTYVFTEDYDLLGTLAPGEMLTIKAPPEPPKLRWNLDYNYDGDLFAGAEFEDPPEDSGGMHTNGTVRLGCRKASDEFCEYGVTCCTPEGDDCGSTRPVKVRGSTRTRVRCRGERSEVNVTGGL